MRPSPLRAFLFAAAATSVAHAAPTVAITEFIIDPNGTDETAPEWIELFNYGAAPVDVTGWTLQDNASSRYTLPAYTIPSGGYVIASRNRANFLTRWLSGAEDGRVLAGDTNFVLNNSSPGDGIYLRDAADAVVFSLGYTIGTDNAASAYRATFLAIDDFTVTNYGVPPQANGNTGVALINRNGLDGTGTLGFEDNNRTADPFARASSVATEFGSPLAGGYTAATPEPATLAAIAGAGLLALRPRRRA